MYTKAQLPVIKAKRAAQLKGATFYEGTPCRFCDNTRRYVSGNKCVKCALFSSRLDYWLRHALARDQC